MDERLKQRLVGATVLVALAVIIIPELVEEPEAPEAPAASLAIPEPPPVREQPVITLSREPEQPVPVIPEPPLPGLTDQTPDGEEALAGEAPAGEGEMPFATDEVPPLVAEPQEPPPPTGSAIATEPTDPEPAPRTRQPVAETPPPPTPPKPAIALPRIELQARSQGPAATAPPPQAAPAQAAPAPVARAQPAPSRSRGWMIQMGSFSRQENAELQREQLAGAGYPVQVEPVRINGRTLYRVRVGPQGSRSESERVLARLLRETGINGQVVAPD